MTFRINQIKTNADDIERNLLENEIRFVKKEIRNGDIADFFYIIDDKKVIDLDVYKDGKIYLQNPSSMYVAIYLYDKNIFNDISYVIVLSRGNS